MMVPIFALIVCEPATRWIDLLGCRLQLDPVIEQGSDLHNGWEQVGELKVERTIRGGPTRFGGGVCVAAGNNNGE